MDRNIMAPRRRVIGEGRENGFRRIGLGRARHAPVSRREKGEKYPDLVPSGSAGTAFIPDLSEPSRHEQTAVRSSARARPGLGWGHFKGRHGLMTSFVRFSGSAGAVPAPRTTSLPPWPRHPSLHPLSPRLENGFKFATHCIRLAGLGAPSRTAVGARHT